jgi:hypothetical protein
MNYLPELCHRIKEFTYAKYIILKVFSPMRGVTTFIAKQAELSFETI